MFYEKKYSFRDNKNNNKSQKERLSIDDRKFLITFIKKYEKFLKKWIRKIYTKIIK